MGNRRRWKVDPLVEQKRKNRRNAKLKPAFNDIRIGYWNANNLNHRDKIEEILEELNNENIHILMVDETHIL